jgi:hypothetical protein
MRWLEDGDEDVRILILDSLSQLSQGVCAPLISLSYEDNSDVIRARLPAALGGAKLDHVDVE